MVLGMARVRLAEIAVAALTAVLTCSLPAGLALADEKPASIAPAPPLTRVPLQLSNECKVKSPAFEGRAALRVVRRALREQRPIRVLAVGTSSTLGGDGPTAVASYPVRLENDIEGLLRGIDVDMTSRAIAAEITDDATQRLQLEVAELKPDLLVWQVGTNDAMARIDKGDFAGPLKHMLEWLASNHVDVVLIDPQYVDKLADDTHYKMIVDTIAEVARDERVLLVHRYNAMADMARQDSARQADTDKGNRFRLIDLGYRCMAEYAARAIVGGIIQADTEVPAQPPQQPQPK